jgi:hypothetical protein
VGWVLDGHSQEAVAGELLSLARGPEKLAALQEHCHKVYQRHFCRTRIMDAWHRELLDLLRLREHAARGRGVNGNGFQPRSLPGVGLKTSFQQAGSP